MSIACGDNCTTSQPKTLPQQTVFGINCFPTLSLQLLMPSDQKLRRILRQLLDQETKPSRFQLTSNKVTAKTGPVRSRGLTA